MDVTRRCDYACRILRAAYKSGDSYVSVSDIAEDEDIPYAFARSIQHDLVKGGLIKTVRGAHGGLALNCDPAEVTLLEVLEAVQGPVSISLCAMDPDLLRKAAGLRLQQGVAGRGRLLNGYFGAITLKDLSSRGPPIRWWKPLWEGEGAHAGRRRRAPRNASRPRRACAAAPDPRRGPVRSA